MWLFIQQSFHSSLQMIPDSQFSLHNIQKPKHTAGSAVTVAPLSCTLAVAFPGSQTELASICTCQHCPDKGDAFRQIPDLLISATPSQVP